MNRVAIAVALPLALLVAGLGVTNQSLAQSPVARPALVRTAEPTPLRIQRNVMRGIEKGFDRQVEKLSLEEPVYLLGMTRGVYLDGYGTVFTAEVNLVPIAALSPFTPAEYSKEVKSKLRGKKADRLPLIRRGMREAMSTAATTLSTLPESERIVMAITLFNYHWEDTSGLPNQIVMEATRRALLQTRGEQAALETAIRVTEN